MAKQTYGRGYLEFDISYIPKKAIIKSVTLQLTSKIAWDSNFNGKIRLYSCGKYKDANSVIWTSLKGFTGLDIMSVDLNREGYGKSVSSAALTQIVSKNVGGSIYLSINHVDENKIIRLSGDPRDLYLEVTYEEKQIDLNPPGGGGSSPYKDPKELYPCPENAISGEEFTLGYIQDLSDVEDIKEVKYDESLFTEIRRSASTVTFIPKQIIGSVRGEITISYKDNFIIPYRLERHTHTWSFPIYGKPYIQNKENIICSGNTTYEIISPSIPNTTTSIQWGTAENMKFISAGNPFLATYSSIAPGKTKVKATVTINGKDDNKDFHREYPIENSEVWVGAPPKLTPLILSPNTSCGTTAVFKIGDSSASLYTKSAFDLSTVDWISSETPSNKTKTSLSVYARYKGSVISVSANVTNKCGTSIGYQATTVVTGNCGIDPGPGIPGQPGLDPGLKSALSEPQPTSIRIYSYPTGSLVYQKKNTISFDIQSTNLGEGIYILEMTDQQGNVTREKVMKGKQ